MILKPLIALAFVFSSFSNVPKAVAEDKKRPNVVFILSDDQDAQLGSLNYMPNVQKLLMQKGTHYERHYCTVALCCPSRVSLWTGKQAHNTNVTNVQYPWGGYQKFNEQRLNESWVPLWLQQAGYKNYYVGKLMNDHTIQNYDNPYPIGFEGTDFLLDPFTYEYLSPGFQRNKEAPKIHAGEYSTDLISQKALGYLEDAAQAAGEAPFFLTIAPIAPHANFHFNIRNTIGTSAISIDKSPPIPAERHKDLFADVKVPRTKNFNPDEPSSVDWVSTLPKLTAENITYNDDWYRSRLQSLQVIDEMLAEVIKKLEDHHILDDTYIFYSSDNGYHISQHRLPPGKGCGFETDINVPLVVRGPGVPEGNVVDLATSHTDLAPTFFEILGLPLRDDFDGVPIPLTRDAINKCQEVGKAKEHVQVEFWDDADPGEYNTGLGAVNNTYKAIRLVGKDYGFYYSVWCAGGHELYDMMNDFDQLENLFSSNSTLMGSIPIQKIAQRLDGLLMVLKTCKGKPCYDPYTVLLPESGVSSLKEALHSKYDHVFDNLPKVQYTRCVGGQILDAEGPQFKGHGNSKKFVKNGNSLNRM